MPGRSGNQKLVEIQRQEVTELKRIIENSKIIVRNNEQSTYHNLIIYQKSYNKYKFILFKTVHEKAIYKYVSID